MLVQQQLAEARGGEDDFITTKREYGKGGGKGGSKTSEIKPESPRKKLVSLAASQQQHGIKVVEDLASSALSSKVGDDFVRSSYLETFHSSLLSSLLDERGLSKDGIFNLHTDVFKEEEKVTPVPQEQPATQTTTSNTPPSAFTRHFRNTRDLRPTRDLRAMRSLSPKGFDSQSPMGSPPSIGGRSLPQSSFADRLVVGSGVGGVEFPSLSLQRPQQRNQSDSPSSNGVGDDDSDDDDDDDDDEEIDEAIRIALEAATSGMKRAMGLSVGGLGGGSGNGSDNFSQIAAMTTTALAATPPTPRSAKAGGGVGVGGGSVLSKRRGKEQRTLTGGEITLLKLKAYEDAREAIGSMAPTPPKRGAVGTNKNHKARKLTYMGKGYTT